MKKQQREEVWAEVDAQAQAVFQNGESLKGFLDFMAPVSYTHLDVYKRQ